MNEFAARFLKLRDESEEQTINRLTQERSSGNISESVAQAVQED